MDEQNRKAYRKEKKEFLIDNIDQLNQELEEAYDKIRNLRAAATPAYTPPPAETNVSLSFDLWPLSEWKNLSLSPWNPGRYFQARLGPIRLDIFQ